MGRAVILALWIIRPSEGVVFFPNSEALLSKLDGVKSPCIQWRSARWVGLVRKLRAPDS